MGGKTQPGGNGDEFALSLETAALAVLLGKGLPDAADRALRRAGLAYQDDRAAERHLAEARRLAPDHPAVLIGLYRYYFYKCRLDEALIIARICLLQAARQNALHPDWRRVEAEDAAFGSYDAVLPRFYMFTLKAYAYLQLRLGDIDEGRDAAQKALSLDPTDRVGVGVLLDVLERQAPGECDD